MEAKRQSEGGDDIQVVANVSVANMVKHGIQYSIITVHCSEGAAEVVPLFAAVVRQLDIRVLKLSDKHQPEIDDEVRNKIHAHHAAKPKMIGKAHQ